MSQIVLFGGTFDPPHVGHWVMAELALEQLQADELWFLPAPVPPHKMAVTWMDDFENRLSMVEAMIEGNPKMKVCTIELQLPKPSYTVDTVAACHRQNPNHHFQFLLGSDSLYHLSSWHRASELVESVEFIVAVRSGYPFEEVLAKAKEELPGLRAKAIKMPILDVSSTWLRGRLEQGLPLCGLVPDAVQRAWKSTKLSKTEP